MYLIWSFEHGAWWRPERAGYTTVLPWQDGAWPPECKRCLRSLNALGRKKP